VREKKGVRMEQIPLGGKGRRLDPPAGYMVFKKLIRHTEPAVGLISL